MTDHAATLVWYVAYGSNLALDRFRCYLRGGAADGGRRVYAGCRDPQDPRASVGLTLAGRLVFSGASTVWGGGMAFHDPAFDGEVACRAYLVTVGQLADVVAQETRQPPGGPAALEIEERLRSVNGDADATAISWGSTGLYDSLDVVGRRDGLPLVTMTHRQATRMTPSPPSPAYLRWIAVGLRESHGWSAERTADYLAGMSGCEGDVVRVLL